MLSSRSAIEAATHILLGPRAEESVRLDRIAAAMRPRADGRQVYVPPGSPQQAHVMAGKAQTNYLPLILASLVQSLHVDGYRAKDAAGNAAPWDWWQANGLDARQTGVHTAALKYGVGYVTVLTGDTGPVIRGISPRKMTAVYGDPAEDDWPILALRVEPGGLLRLYDEEGVHFLGREGPPGARGADLRFIESRPHDMGVCPVVRFRDLMLLEDEEQLGVIEPLLAIQSRIDETVFGQLLTQYVQAFKQRYVIGWAPEDEAERLKAAASELWTFLDPDVKVGEFAATDPGGYIASKDSAVRDMAAISQVPPQQLAVGAISNLSAEALASLEAGKDRKINDVETSLGESWEQALRLAGVAAHDEAAAADTSAQVRWRDATARSLAQVADALTKLVSMGLPVEMALERIPGFTDQDVERAVALRLAGDPFAALDATLAAQATAAGL